MNCQIHYSRRTTMSKFHTPRRDEFSSRLVLLSFLLLLLYKRGRKMIDRSQQMEVYSSKWSQRQKRTHLNLWTAERNDTPPVPNVFQLHQLFFTLIRMSIRFSLFFWISSRLLLYTDLNVLWPLWPLLPTIFFLRNTYHSKNEVTMTNQQLPSVTKHLRCNQKKQRASLTLALEGLGLIFGF